LLKEKLDNTTIYGRKVSEAIPSFVSKGIFDIIQNVYLTEEDAEITLLEDDFADKLSYRAFSIKKTPTGEVIVVFDDLVDKLPHDVLIERIANYSRNNNKLESTNNEEIREKETKDNICTLCNRNEYRKLLEAAGMYILFTDSDGKVIDASKSFPKYLGIPSDKQIIGSRIQDLISDTDAAARMQSVINECSTAGYREPSVITFRRNAENCMKNLYAEMSGILSSDRRNIIILVRDVTGEKDLEKQYKDLERQSSFLLQEVQHRARNNLQFIKSLLSLQLSLLDKNKEAYRLLKECQNRILILSLIYNRITHLKDLNKVLSSTLINNTVQNIITSYSLKKKQIEVKCDSDETYLTVETGIVLSLILHEALSNAFTHAFSERSGGNVNVQFRVIKRSEEEFSVQGVKRAEVSGCVFRLEIEDDGSGMPANLSSLTNPQTFGLSIIKHLVSQINGTAEIKSEPGKGTKLSITGHEIYTSRLCS
ncbi:MAG: histidine kinase dimerization/phosphoacceptor domain -containing protein, partial [Thermoplasmata archaeon]